MILLMHLHYVALIITVFTDSQSIINMENACVKSQ